MLRNICFERFLLHPVLGTRRGVNESFCNIHRFVYLPFGVRVVKLVGVKKIL